MLILMMVLVELAITVTLVAAAYGGMWYVRNREMPRVLQLQAQQLHARFAEERWAKDAYASQPAPAATPGGYTSMGSVLGGGKLKP